MKQCEQGLYPDYQDTVLYRCRKIIKDNKYLIAVINTDAGYEELTDDDTPLYGEGDVDDEPLYNLAGVPSTGDESNIPVWAGLCALAAAGLIVMMSGRRKKEEE